MQSNRSWYFDIPGALRHYVVQERGDGQLYCSCPSWVFYGRERGGCKHTRQVQASMGIVPQRPPQGEYELMPREGMTYTERLNELHAARFVAVRNLAVVVYKKPDGNPLMAYGQTLDERDPVKHLICQHELKLGLIQPDYPAPKPAEDVSVSVEKTVERVLGDALKPEKLRPMVVAAVQELKAKKRRKK